jgi:hypothetical protein
MRKIPYIRDGTPTSQSASAAPPRQRPWPTAQPLHRLLAGELAGDSQAEVAVGLESAMTFFLSSLSNALEVQSGRLPRLAQRARGNPYNGRNLIGVSLPVGYRTKCTGRVQTRIKTSC